MLRSHPTASPEELTRLAKKLDLKQLLTLYIDSVKEKESSQEFASSAFAQSAALEQRNEINLSIWSVIRQKTIDHLQSLWKLFGVHFDIIQVQYKITLSNL